MLRSQKTLITVGLLFLAYFLHVNLCDWKFKEHLPNVVEDGKRVYVHKIIWVWKHEQPPPPGPPGIQRSSQHAYTGLLTQSRVDFVDAVVFGVVLPLSMLMLLVYFWLGWWRDAKIARGLCVACGYDLRGAPSDAARCPECGAMRKGHKVSSNPAKAPNATPPQ